MASYGWRLNRRGVADLLDSPGVRADLMRRGHAVRAAAAAGAPRESGRLAGAHRVETDRAADGRPRVRVIADTPYAAVVAANGNNWLAVALEAARG